MNIKWDANGYTKNFSFVNEYGNDLIGLIDIEEGMTCIDLGCGNGSLTKRLKDTGLSVMGIDASRELLEIAKENYTDITFINDDAVTFKLSQPVDIVFSNAVFHWINKENQEDMLRNIYYAMKDGGQFVFEFGGKGNNDLIHHALNNAFKIRGLQYQFPFYFPSIGEYTSLMEHVGFRVSYAILFERPTLLNGEDGLYDWIRMFVKNPFIGISEMQTQEIIREAVNVLKPELYKDGKWYADYVRLRCKAVKQHVNDLRY